MCVLSWSLWYERTTTKVRIVIQTGCIGGVGWFMGFFFISAYKKVCRDPSTTAPHPHHNYQPTRLGLLVRYTVAHTTKGSKRLQCCNGFKWKKIREKKNY